MSTIISAGPPGEARSDLMSSPGGMSSRRAKVVIRHLDPWSVLKVSLLFYFCVMIVGLFALAIVYWVLGSMGALSSISGFVTDVTGTKKVYVINGGWIFVRVFAVGVGSVLVWSLVNVCLAVLYNLISDVVGGIRVTLAEPK
jgi:Transmembrane domain of unknown function (DUF3566)